MPRYCMENQLFERKESLVVGATKHAQVSNYQALLRASIASNSTYQRNRCSGRGSSKMTSFTDGISEHDEEQDNDNVGGGGDGTEAGEPLRHLGDASEDAAALAGDGECDALSAGGWPSKVLELAGEPDGVR
jgi:hypothetical protein